MYDKYVPVNHTFKNEEEWLGEWIQLPEKQVFNLESDGWTITRKLNPKTHVESVFVLNARKSRTVPLGALFALIVMIFAALGIIVQRGKIGK